MHQQVTGLPGPVPGGNGFATVSCDPYGDTWRQVHETLVNLDGTLVTYTLYRVGTCPVSVYTGPQRWEPYRTGWRVTREINGMEVRAVGDHAMTTWLRAGRREVLVASGPPEQTAALAQVFRSRLTGPSGL
jgi:hypothetical protein